MFGKTKELNDTEAQPEDGATIDEFFGDEAGVAESVRVDQLQQRVTQVEQQINSQFTSLAAYAQIAQEQVELVRSEAQHGKERSEQRVIELIERERADRMASSPGAPIDVVSRLDKLDNDITEIREGLQRCLSNQKALADAITDLFAPITEAPDAGPASVEPTTSDAPVPTPATTPAVMSDAMPDAMPEAMPDTMPDATFEPMPAPAQLSASETLPPPPALGAPLAPITAAQPSPMPSSEFDVAPTTSIQPIDLGSNGLVDGPIDGLSLN